MGPSVLQRRGTFCLTPPVLSRSAAQHGAQLDGTLVARPPVHRQIRQQALQIAGPQPNKRHRRVVAAASSAAAALPEDTSRPSNIAKLAALAGMFFCSTFNYTILQNLKDSIVVTTVGAEALPFLEAWGVLPMSLGFFMAYKWMNRHLPDSWIYQAALSPFLAFYALFAFVLYPMAGVLHPTHLLESFRAALPAGLVGLAGMVVHYTYSLFFILGELWGGVAISLLFWGFADDVCSMDEAKNVYPLLGFIANIGLVVAGALIKAVNKQLAGGGPTSSPQAVQALLGMVLAGAAALMVFKGYVQENFVTKDPEEAEKKRAKREARAAKEASSEGGVRKGGLRDSLLVLKRSPKVGNLAILVISYFVTSKLFDFAWKAQLRVFYPTTAAYQAAMADVAQWTGITTMILMATSKFVFKWGGWTTAAIATPLSMLVSGAVFFASAIAMRGGASALGPEAVAWLIAAGSVAGVVGRVMSRAPKYSLFDPAKEMVYITMNKDEKNEGKATVDLLGSYFGKSGASWIMQGLVLALGSLTQAMPIMGLVHVVIGGMWVRSTVSLGKIMAKESAKLEAKTTSRSSSSASASTSSTQSSGNSSSESTTSSANGNGYNNGNGASHSMQPSNGGVSGAGSSGADLLNGHSTIAAAAGAHGMSNRAAVGSAPHSMSLANGRDLATSQGAGNGNGDSNSGLSGASGSRTAPVQGAH